MESLKNWIKKHPNLAAWFVLALGMVILLVFEAREVGLESKPMVLAYCGYDSCSGRGNLDY